ncbi:Phosphatidate cytidylyltransferase-like protein 1 [Elsinoe fawcettii]|nr:Phosphatidate cytidylyltransferase-like protein 1 [Elsinoe fawcettii]
MSLRRLSTTRGFEPLVAGHSFIFGQLTWQHRPQFLRPQLQTYATEKKDDTEHFSPSFKPAKREPTPSPTSSDLSNQSMPEGWEDNPDLSITTFSQLPHKYFGTNQHIRINEDFKESLRQILWEFKAPIRYAFAYGSGVFSQSNKPASPDALSPHPHPPEAIKKWQENGGKIIDFIFGVSYTQHWHSINLQQYPEHYSALKYLGSYTVSKVQDSWGAGVYFNPYITVNGTMIKYGVVNLNTICRDLSEWDTLYLAGRLQKPVKILRDDPRVRLANQINLMSAVRTALLMLPQQFTERQLYETITSLSYLGDPRMSFGGENTSKVRNIVRNQLPNFRQLYVPLIDTLPNVAFNDSRIPREPGWEREDVMAKSADTRNPAEIIGGLEGFTMQQDMSPQRRGNMVRRLPRLFRQKLYYQYRKKFAIPGSAFDKILDESKDEDAASFIGKREAGEFERRIAGESDVAQKVETCVRNTIAWPSTSQSVKGIMTAGVSRGWRYWSEKRKRYAESASKEKKNDDGKGEKEEKKE